MERQRRQQQRAHARSARLLFAAERSERRFARRSRAFELRSRTNRLERRGKNASHVCRWQQLVARFRLWRVAAAMATKHLFRCSNLVIVTSALGYLKENARSLFVPPLPAPKLEAIDYIGTILIVPSWQAISQKLFAPPIAAVCRFLGFGAIEKLFLVYDVPFWCASDVDRLVTLHVDGCEPRGRLSNAIGALGTVDFDPNVLVAWISGEGVDTVDALDDTELIDELTRHLRATMASLQRPRRQNRNRDFGRFSACAQRNGA